MFQPALPVPDPYTWRPDKSSKVSRSQPCVSLTSSCRSILQPSALLRCTVMRRTPKVKHQEGALLVPSEPIDSATSKHWSPWRSEPKVGFGMGKSCDKLRSTFLPRRADGANAHPIARSQVRSVRD